MTELIQPKMVLKDVINKDDYNVTFQEFKYDKIHINHLVKYKLEIKYKRLDSIKSIKQIC
jgi:hypothetical protein